MQLSSCLPSEALNFQVASRFLDNLCTPGSSYTDDRMVKWIIANHENGSGRGLIWGTDQTSVETDWRKQNSVRTGDLRAKIWTWNLQHTKQMLRPQERDGTGLSALSPVLQNTLRSVLHFCAFTVIVRITRENFKNSTCLDCHLLPTAQFVTHRERILSISIMSHIYVSVSTRVCVCVCAIFVQCEP